VSESNTFMFQVVSHVFEDGVFLIGTYGQQISSTCVINFYVEVPVYILGINSTDL
jgi:hypothetical protein